MWEKRPTCFKQRKVEVVRDFPKALLENKPCSNVDSSFKSLPPMDKKSAHNICLNKSTVILEYITYAGQLHIEGVSGPLWEHQLSGDRNKKGGKEVKDMPTQIKEKSKQEALFRYVKKRPDIKNSEITRGKTTEITHGATDQQVQYVDLNHEKHQNDSKTATVENISNDDECKNDIVANQVNRKLIQIIDRDDEGNDMVGKVNMRKKVMNTLNLYHEIFAKLLSEKEAQSNVKHGSLSDKSYMKAAMLLKQQQKWLHMDERIIGPVPGVEIGDKFNYRVELVIIGLHRQFSSGIDYIKGSNGANFAISIVASGLYDNDTSFSNVLIYSGQGGNPKVAHKKPTDQRLEKGNLALRNSMDAKNPIRVIRGLKSIHMGDEKNNSIYIYDGLYHVVDFWQKRGEFGKVVFRFKLRRIKGQPELTRLKMKNAKEFKLKDCVHFNVISQGKEKKACEDFRINDRTQGREKKASECFHLDDISQGKEKNPIRAVNTIDDDGPPWFNYISNMIYLESYRLLVPSGCDCTNGCLFSKNCSCLIKNGGEISYNQEGCILEGSKNLVYECGPLCKCNSSCYNRVTQLGIRFPLEVFKTNKNEWGVRSRVGIPSGSFICEYLGELSNENGTRDTTSQCGCSKDRKYIRIIIDGSSAIDASLYGNVGRFINHSCFWPNLSAQNVLYDHDDKRMPHIMLFAIKDIPPLEELTCNFMF